MVFCAYYSLKPEGENFLIQSVRQWAEGERHQLKTTLGGGRGRSLRGGLIGLNLEFDTGVDAEHPHQCRCHSTNSFKMQLCNAPMNDSLFFFIQQKKEHSRWQKRSWELTDVIHEVILYRKRICRHVWHSQMTLHPHVVCCAGDAEHFYLYPIELSSKSDTVVGNIMSACKTILAVFLHWPLLPVKLQWLSGSSLILFYQLYWQLLIT